MQDKKQRLNIITEFAAKKKMQSLLIDLPAEIADKLDTTADGSVDMLSLIKALSDYPEDDLKTITRH